MSTGARTEIGRAKLAKRATKHGFYSRNLTEEQQKAWSKVPTTTDCSGEIKLMRTHIDELNAKIAGGAVSVPGMRGEIFLEDILVRKTAMLNSLLRSQHVMHPESGNDAPMRLEITVQGNVDIDVKDLDQGGAESAASNDPLAPDEGPDPKGHSLEDLLGEDP